MTAKKIFLIAGETSGDQLAGELMRALSVKMPGVEFRGIGGSHMLRAGLTDSLFPMEELSLMGLMEVVPKIPKMLNRINQTVKAIKAYNPDMVITIDAPDFSFRVQKELKAQNVRAKKVHYVAPTVWAWRPERARKIAAFLDGLICLFPFEPDYFEREGLRSVAVGHPVMKSGALTASATEFRQSRGIAADRKLMGLFFGSRKSELERLSDVIIAVAKSLRADIPDIGFVVPTLPRWHEYLSNRLINEGLDAYVTSTPSEKWQAYKACDAALATSGTVALEIAVADVPHAIVYKMNSVTWSIVKRMIESKYAHLANIILGKRAVPEFLQDDASVDKVLPVMRDMLLSPAVVAFQKSEFERVREELQPGGNADPSELAADFICRLLK